MKVAAAFVAPLLLAACATAPPLKHDLPKPAVRIDQTNRIAEIATHQSGAVGVEYRVVVANTTKQPITVRRVDLQSVGSGAYSLPLLTKPFALVIQPGQSSFVEMSGPAYILDPAVLIANGPVTLRLTLAYETTGGSNQLVLMQQVFPPSD